MQGTRMIALPAIILVIRTIILMLWYVPDLSYPLAFGLPATVPKLSSLCLGDPRFETEVPSPNDPFVISV